MLFSSYSRLSGWQFCKMRCEASKLWRTGFFPLILFFEIFHGSLPNVKQIKYSVERLRALRFGVYFFPFLCVRGETWCLCISETWGKHTSVEDLQPGWFAQLRRVLLFSFHSRPQKSYLFSTWLEPHAFAFYHLSGSTEAKWRSLR